VNFELLCSGTNFGTPGINRLEEEMGEPYVEGVAIHGGPESCVVVCEGGGEALTGYVQAALSSHEMCTPECLRCRNGGRQHRRRRYSEVPSGPAWSKNQGMHGAFMCENQEIPRLPVRVTSGRAPISPFERLAQADELAQPSHQSAVSNDRSVREYSSRDPSLI
jgi:hypothetical protein